MKTIFFALVFCIPTLIFSQFVFHNPDETSGSLTNLGVVNNSLVVLSKGANRILEYDGENWKSFNTSDYSFGSLFSNPNELYIDNEGHYWLVYSKDIDLFDGSEVQNLTQSNFGFNNEYLNDVVQDEKGNFFFSHENGSGISMLANNQWTHVGDYTGSLELLNSVSVASFLAFDNINTCIWIYSAGRFLQYKDNSIIEFTESSLDIDFDLSVGNCRDMTVTSDGKVWFAISNNSENSGGILTYDGESWDFLDKDAGLPAEHVVGITSVNDEIYIADSFLGKISKLQNGVWTTYTNENSNWPEYFYATMYEMIELNSQVYIATNNGVIQLESTTVGNKINEFQSHEIFPNPTNSYVSIKSIDTNEIKSVTVINALGQVVSVFNNPELSQIPLYGNSGIYYVILELEDGTMERHMVLKQ